MACCTNRKSLFGNASSKSRDSDKTRSEDEEKRNKGSISKKNNGKKGKPSEIRQKGIRTDASKELAAAKQTKKPSLPKKLTPQGKRISAQREPQNKIDAIIEKLLAVRHKKPGHQNVELDQADIKKLCMRAKDIMLSQPMLLQVPAPVKILGDIHGQFTDLLRILEKGGYPGESNYIFLGDYVDRGKQSLEVICLLLAYKIKYPTGIWLLRGNHECASINRIYGFYDECKRRYTHRLWKLFTSTFDCFPVAGVIDEKIFCVHGGLSPDLKLMDEINQIKRPTGVPEEGILTDLLWSDPDINLKTEWGPSDRGVSSTFGRKTVEKFLEKHDLDLICRAHQVVEDGYEFFGDRQLVTIFSAPNYCSFGNLGGMMVVDETLMCSFQTIEPL